MPKWRENATAPESVFQLLRLIGDLLFPEGEELWLWVTVSQENMDFASKLNMMCSVRYDEKCEFFSPRIGYSEQQNIAFEINARWSCLAMRLEKSHTDLHL